MRKAYLLVHNLTLSRDIVKSWANHSEVVITWRCDLPNCFYFVSEFSADEISYNFQNFLMEYTDIFVNSRFLITEVSENRQGWLPKETWYLLKNKSLKSS